MAAWIYWLIISAVLLIVELASGTVGALCAGVGCFLAAVVSMFGVGFEWQLFTFLVGLVLAFIFLAPLVNRYRKRNPLGKGEYNSNMDALIGREGVLDSSASEEPGRFGRMSLDGASWQVKSDSGLPIPSGTAVKVVNYDSIILIVKPL